jgi:hypothetical protein
MRHSLAGLGAALLVVFGLSGSADAQGLKPYVVFDLDTSGSMGTSTGAGPTTCGTTDTRLNHARCAINRIANGYGDMVFALGRFRMSVTGTYSTSCTADCALTGAGTTGGATCNGNQDDRFELLTALVDGSNQDAATWTDATCNTCGTAIGSNPEIFEPDGNTPIGGSLAGARRYWQGLQATNGTTIWPSASAGFDPIFNDPLRLEYIVGDGSAVGDQQCRPYIVISLTDGDETCNGNAPAMATAMYDTTRAGLHYRITTEAIGFGQTPGDTQIEALAVAGHGGVDKPGTCNSSDRTGCDGFYAQNEQDLSLAIASILAGTIRSETCNDEDDDCDNEVDEDFPSLDTACDDGLIGVCRGTGVFVCSGDGTGTVCSITNPGQAPQPEICNGLDDNCNGFIDEGLMCGGCGDAETCNNNDDDCDGAVDEDLVRPCGTDVGQCTAGTETCDEGAWEGCTATGPFTEVCDGVDNDCDGTCDGFSIACSDVPGGNPNIGPCHDGISTCPAVCGPTNSFGPCLDEVVPTAEVCNCEDDNCNGTDDEGTGGANCDTSCGVGNTVCNPATCMLECNSVIVPGPEVICDGFDDDCDMMTDEDYVPVACDAGGTLCNGLTQCLPGGNEICVGDTIAPEQCDCEDNDCDTMTDENNGNCPDGSTCTSCECAFPCGEGEFPCPQGRVCEDGFCVTDHCFLVTCDPEPDGDATVCVDADVPEADCLPDETHCCEPACDHLSQPCPPGTVCFGPTGQCVFDDCRTFPEECAADQLCQAGVCVTNPCFDVTCPSTQYCIGGQCTASCGDVECTEDQRCELGMCEADPCAETGPCGQGQVCDDASGMCVTNPCNGRTCPQGEVCDPQTGDCVADPCTGVTCPGEDICEFGTCFDPGAFTPDAEGPEQHVTTGGGGGCSTGGGGGSSAGILVMLLLLLRRRSRGGRS